MFLDVAPIQWIIGICRWLWDENNLPICRCFEVWIFELLGIKHMRAIEALLLNEGGIILVLVRGGDSCGMLLGV